MRVLVRCYVTLTLMHVVPRVWCCANLWVSAGGVVVGDMVDGFFIKSICIVLVCVWIVMILYALFKFRYFIIIIIELIKLWYFPYRCSIIITISIIIFLIFINKLCWLISIKFNLIFFKIINFHNIIGIINIFIIIMIRWLF